MTAVTHRSDTPGRERLGQWINLAGPALLALVLGTAAWLAHFHGTDLAAQAYRSDIVKLHGIVVWDNGWYDGSFPLSYSVLSPIVGAVLGLAVSSILAAVVATACFDRIVVHFLGHRTLGSWYFAVSTLLAVTIGQVPYLSGEAVALGAVLALLKGHKKLAVFLGLVSVLFSPLAAAFLVLVCLVWAIHDRARRWSAIAVAAACSVVVGAISLAFPGSGPFPFGWGGLVISELLCLTVLSPLVRTTKPIRLGAAIYAVASLGSFIVPNPIGGNATRLAESFGIPIVACLVTAPSGWRPRMPSRLWRWLTLPTGRTLAGVIVLIPFVVWQWAPSTGVVASASPTTVPSTTDGFYQPLVHQLQRRSHGRPVRVEVVPQVDHWEAAWVAPYVSLARGWERQLDVKDNPIFYVKGELNPKSYRAWLLTNGVMWVALPNAPLDYAGKPEAALLRSGRVLGLKKVWTTRNWTMWRVLGSPGLVSGPGRVAAIAPDHIDFVVTKPGTLFVRIRFSSYWRLGHGLTRASACVAATPGGWTDLRAAKAGPVRLSASLIDGPSATCTTNDKS